MYVNIAILTMSFINMHNDTRIMNYIDRNASIIIINENGFNSKQYKLIHFSQRRSPEYQLKLVKNEAFRAAE